MDNNNNTRECLKDKADLVQTIIIIAGFAVASIVGIGGITTVIMEKGEATADCVAKQSTFSTKNGIDFNNGCEPNNVDDKGSIVPYTPEHCFTMNASSPGTIADYNTSLSNCTSDVIIPPKINGNKVTSFGDSAFRNNNLTSVLLPNTLKTISANAFHTNNLTTVTIPSNVTGISHGAFAYNDIKTITFPNSLNTIGHGAFQSNNLTTITFPDSLTNIGGNAFTINELTTVSLPSNTIISEQSFDSGVSINRY